MGETRASSASERIDDFILEGRPPRVYGAVVGGKLRPGPTQGKTAPYCELVLRPRGTMLGRASRRSLHAAMVGDGVISIRGRNSRNGA